MEKILSNKWLKIGLFSVAGLILAVGLVFAGYQLRQRKIWPLTLTTRDLTADWETYINQRDGYSIRYLKEWSFPKGWSLIEPPPSSAVFVSQQEDPPFIVEVAVEDEYMGGLTNEELTTFVFGEHADRVKYKWSDITIGSGINGKQVEYVLPRDGRPGDWTRRIFVVNDHRLYILSLVGEENQISPETKQTFNLMLSTFRFLE